MYPSVQASGGQEEYYIRSTWLWVILWVRLTFSQTYPPSRGISWWPRAVLSWKVWWVQFFHICCLPFGEASHTLQCRRYELLKIEQFIVDWSFCCCCCYCCYCCCNNCEIICETHVTSVITDVTTTTELDIIENKSNLW